MLGGKVLQGLVIRSKIRPAETTKEGSDASWVGERAQKKGGSQRKKKRVERVSEILRRETNDLGLRLKVRVSLRFVVSVGE